MPAVTVEDLSTLPTAVAPAPGARPRSVRSVTTAPSGFEGEGFPVRRAFAGVDLADLDPFVPSTRSVRWTSPQGSRRGRRGTRTGASRR